MSGRYRVALASDQDQEPRDQSHERHELGDWAETGDKRQDAHQDQVDGEHEHAEIFCEPHRFSSCIKPIRKPPRAGLLPGDMRSNWKHYGWVEAFSDGF